MNNDTELAKKKFPPCQPPHTNRQAPPPHKPFADTQFDL